LLLKSNILLYKIKTMFKTKSCSMVQNNEPNHYTNFGGFENDNFWRSHQFVQLFPTVILTFLVDIKQFW